MNLSRRSFLGGTLSLFAASASANVPLGPRLWADGLHNDSPALNALFAGKPFYCENTKIYDISTEFVLLKNGLFRLSEPVLINNLENSTIMSSIFKCDAECEYAFIVENVRNIRIVDNIIYNEMNWEPPAFGLVLSGNSWCGR